MVKYWTKFKEVLTDPTIKRKGQNQKNITVFERETIFWEKTITKYYPNVCIPAFIMGQQKFIC